MKGFFLLLFLFFLRLLFIRNTPLAFKPLNGWANICVFDWQLCWLENSDTLGSLEMSLACTESMRASLCPTWSQLALTSRTHKQRKSHQIKAAAFCLSNNTFYSNLSLWLNWRGFDINCLLLKVYFANRVYFVLLMVTSLESLNIQ